MFKINDKVQMTCDGSYNGEPSWETGDVGRIVHIENDLIPYLICFDSNCHEMHQNSNDHTYWSCEEFIKSYPNPLMTIE